MFWWSKNNFNWFEKFFWRKKMTGKSLTTSPPPNSKSFFFIFYELFLDIENLSKIHIRGLNLKSGQSRRWFRHNNGVSVSIQEYRKFHRYEMEAEVSLLCISKLFDMANGWRRKLLQVKNLCPMVILLAVRSCGLKMLPLHWPRMIPLHRQLAVKSIRSEWVEICHSHVF